MLSSKRIWTEAYLQDDKEEEKLEIAKISYYNP